MMHWASHLNSGDIVYVRGMLRRTKQPIKGCSLMDLEIWIEKLQVLVYREERLPFSVYEAEICPRRRD
jgi:aspartyl-tRNA synthetase